MGHRSLPTGRRLLLTAPLWVLGCLCLATAAPAQAGNVRVSLADNGAQPNGFSGLQAVSGDGRFVVFASNATNLIPGGSSGTQLFVRDLALGTTEIVSVSSAGAISNSSENGSAAISADGRFVAFQTTAANLVPQDTSTNYKVVVRDRWAGVTVLASVPAPGGSGGSHSYSPALSGSGRYVAFDSSARLVPADSDNQEDVYLRDLWAGTTERVSVPLPGGGNDNQSISPSISYDGRFVAFQSESTRLVSGDTNGAGDVFVRDRLTGTTIRASVPTALPQAEGAGQWSSISWDGQFVVFSSSAPSLGASSGSGVFVRDLAAGVTERVDIPMGPPYPPGSFRDFVGFSISADGRFVTFASSYNGMAPGDAVGGSDVYLRDRKTGITLRASLDAIGADPNGISQNGIIAPLGNMVVFASDATNIVAGDTNGQLDVFATDTASLLYPFRYQTVVKQAYRDLLGREPEPQALAGWNNFLSQGGDRLELGRTLAYSQEYRQLLVSSLYVWLLRRQADTGGRSAWVDFLSQGGAIEQVEVGLISSHEYFFNRAGGTNSGFLRAVYADLLNRRPDPGGESWYGRALAAGVPREQVVVEIINSQEAKELRVRRFFWWLLRRDADPLGLFWGVDALNRGARDEDVIAALLASDEYFLRAQ